MNANFSVIDVYIRRLRLWKRTPLILIWCIFFKIYNQIVSNNIYHFFKSFEIPTVIEPKKLLKRTKIIL